MDSPHAREINILFPRPNPSNASENASDSVLNAENARRVTINDASVVRYGRREDADAFNKNEESMPLIDAESAPLAASEIDDLDGSDGIPPVAKPHPSVGEAFFVPNGPEKPLSKDGLDLMERAGGFDGDHVDQPNGQPGFQHQPEFGIGISDLESIPDVNIYQHKKTVAQGMMDIALFSANANQLRYVLESSSHPYYYPGIVLITISLAFQIAVGVGLLLNTRYNVKDKREICIANKINNFTIIGIFLVTVINVFISAFGVATDVTITTNVAVASNGAAPQIPIRP